MLVTPAKKQPAEYPQSSWLLLDADHEKQENSTEFCKMQNMIRILNESQRGRADHWSSSQAPQDRAEAESLAWRIGDQSRHDINQRFAQESYPDTGW